MPYEIPQKLQYEEKIIFNLTFRQMIYLAIFGFPALIIFLIVKSELRDAGILGAAFTERLLTALFTLSWILPLTPYNLK